MLSEHQNKRSRTPDDNNIIREAIAILDARYGQQTASHQPFTSPVITKDYLRLRMSDYQREVFAVLLLDSQHQLIRYEELFYGTIDAAAVYPREVVKLTLARNAAAVIFAHNHPSGCPEPSDADRRITERLKAALATIDIPVLDHLVIGHLGAVSFADRGWL